MKSFIDRDVIYIKKASKIYIILICNNDLMDQKKLVCCSTQHPTSTFTLTHNVHQIFQTETKRDTSKTSHSILLRRPREL